MKFTVLLFLLFLILGRIRGQENSTFADVTDSTAMITEAISQTTGSGEDSEPDTTAVSTETTSVTTVDSAPCDPTPCQNGGTCDDIGNGQFICVCADGYMGQTCNNPSGCKADSRQIWSNETKQVCDNSSSTASDGVYERVQFGEVSIGQSSPSMNYTCGDGCQISGKPAAALRCVEDESGGASFEETPRTVNCSTNYDELEPAEQAQLLAIGSTDTNGITTDEITTTVEKVSTLSKSENMAKEMSDDLLTTINNLLQVDEEAAIQEQSQSILSSVSNISHNVQLGPIEQYREAKSDVALGVFDVTSSTTSRKRRATDSIYYGTSSSLNSNLASSDLVLTTDEPSGSYLKAVSCASGRAQFQVYNSESELFSGDSLSANLLTTVFYVDCPGESSYTFKFQTTETNVDFSEIKGNGDLGSTNYRVVKWDGSKWEDNNCTDYVGRGIFITCTCKDGGPVALRKVSIEDGGGGGLSGGAIAGIVIGCVAGVALIGGLVFYLVKRNKKKKAQKVKPVDHASEYGGSHRNDGYDSD